jgi:hypothetical protein
VAYQITLSEDDYAALVAASTQTGEPIEQLVHKAIAARYESPYPSRQIGNYRYPTGEPFTEEEEEEMERLAQEIGPQHPTASEIVIEDRGPR